MSNIILYTWNHKNRLVLTRKEKVKHNKPMEKFNGGIGKEALIGILLRLTSRPLFDIIIEIN